jgi:anti-sigma factor RsiW
MSCNHDEALLDRYLDGELSAELRLRVEANVQDCEHCRRYVEDIHSIRQALQYSSARSVANAPLDSLWETIRTQLPNDSEESPHSQTPSLGERLRRWWGPPAMEWALGGAVAALAVLIGVWALHTPPNATPSPNATAAVTHEFIVESYEVSEGTVIIDVDPQQDMPAIVWHFVDEEEDYI